MVKRSLINALFSLPFPSRVCLQSIPHIFAGPCAFSKDSETVNLDEFHEFLSTNQDDFLRDAKAVSNFITEFVQDPQREVQQPYLTISEVRPFP